MADETRGYDIEGLRARLRQTSNQFHYDGPQADRATRELLLEAEKIIGIQKDAYADMHRRAQAVEKPAERLLAKAKVDARWANTWARQEFQRTTGLLSQIGLLYKQMLRAEPTHDDLLDKTVSCSDLAGPGTPASKPAGEAWCGRTDADGVRHHVSPLATLTALMDELLLLRGQQSLREGHAGARAAASDDHIIPGLLEVHKLAIAAMAAKPDDMGATFSTREDLGRAAFKIADAVLYAMIEIERLRALNPDTSRLHPRIAAARDEVKMPPRILEGPGATA